MLSGDVLKNIFSFKPGKLYLKKRESSNVEFKKSFHITNLPEYGRNFASFANNRGGHIVFGVKDRPHIPIGLQDNRFADTDEAIITEFMNQHFAPAIDWSKDTYEWNGSTFGIIYIYESNNKPVIAINDGGRKQEIKSGEIYFRYIGRSEKIRHAELTQIIEERIRHESDRWRDLFEKISRIGPQNTAILDTLEGKIEEGNRTILIDDELVKKIKFIKDGQFNEKEGLITLKLIGEVKPVSVAGVKHKIIHDDPYTLRPKDVAQQVAKAINRPFSGNSTHVRCWQYYRARGSYDEGKTGCNPEYCDYKENLNYFMYTQKWVDFLIEELSDPEEYQRVMSA